MGGLIGLSVAMVGALLLTAAGPASMVRAQGGTPTHPTYYLPAPSGTPLFVEQGNDTGLLGGDHAGASRFAYDFAIATDASFPVVAARAGVVESVRSDVADGNCPDVGEAVAPPCWSDANYVVIDHLDGTAALYLHLAQGTSSGLAPGQAVERGQSLGDSGSSGWTSGTGLHFMVMTDEPAAAGAPPWWRTSTGPIAFEDDSVRAVHADGVPGDGLTEDGPFVSGNPGPASAQTGPQRPIAQPQRLPGRLPWAAGTAHSVAKTGVAAPDGFGFDVVAGGRGDGISTETEAYPLFSGSLRYAGCASGTSAQLGRIVVIDRVVGQHDYQAIFAHLSTVDAELTAPGATSPSSVTSDQPIGTFGASSTSDDGTCDGTDGKPVRLHVSLLQDALVTPSGEILGGTPVIPWPLQGLAAYVPLRWWKGPMTAIDIDEADRAPSGSWARGTTRKASHVPYGRPVDLVVRARSAADLREVRILAMYKDWPQRRPGEFRGLDPTRTWRVVAVCRRPGVRGVSNSTRACAWDGNARSARVSYRWDPTAPDRRRRVPWLPPARAALGQATRNCVPVTFAFEVYDESGLRFIPPARKAARRCDATSTQLGRTVYLDPLHAPPAPASAKITCTLWANLYCENDVLSWKRSSTNETGFRLYVESYLYTPSSGKCKILKHKGPWLIATRPAASKQWASTYGDVYQMLGQVPGKDRMIAIRLSVSAFNAAGESSRNTASGRLDSGDDVIC